MAFSAPKKNKNSEQNKHKQLRWYETAVGCRTPTGYINIQHDTEQHRLIFHSNGMATEEFESAEALVHVLMSKNHRVFLEWCQVDTGSYIYFNLGLLVQSLAASEAVHHSLDVNVLTLQNDHGTDEKQADNADASGLDDSCYFDESVPVDSVLAATDILIISPLRSMHQRYTPMGIYQGHQLYLGPLPTVEFINQCKVRYLMNCCLNGNKPEIESETAAKERVFNVAGWKWTKQYTHTPLVKGQDAVGHHKKMGPMAYLDTMVDEIHQQLATGNILIHCLAGAHRSPFITGCYLLKYGLKGTEEGQSAESIYAHLKGKRRIVQELGYDKKLNQYRQFLAKQKHLEDEQ